MYILPIMNDNFKVRHVLGVFPTLFISTKSSFWFESPTALAVNFGIFSMIRAECAAEKEIIAHEMVHVEQMYRTFFLSPMLYYLNDKHAVKEEAEAYVRANVEKKAHLINYAYGIQEQYAKNSDVTIEYIHEQLKKCWKKYRE